jgi:quercetin 2,3-dioxygenase
VLQTIPLGFQWATADPFLFCVHHLDHYPAGNARSGPAASLAGRQLGQDFEGRDGWRMYHGQTVPGFPQHPHRGFETVTYVRRGLVDHADSLGAAARYGSGDVQWMTAGRGIVHAEMFPLLDQEGPNTLELFQIWVNLPSVDKMVEPHFSMLWDQDIPRLPLGGPDAPFGEVTVIAGQIEGLVPPPPPPHSWAARPESDFAMWHIRLNAAGSWTIPAAAGDGTVRVLYVFEGADVRLEDAPVDASTGAVVRCDVPVEVTSRTGAEILMLQARPIGEPVAQYGPFVMNTEDEIRQAFADYRATEFGGWPWPTDDPVHGTDPVRFARHADGMLERQAG